MNVFCGIYTTNNILYNMVWKQTDIHYEQNSYITVIDPVIIEQATDGIIFKPLIPFSNLGEVLVKNDSISSMTDCPMNLLSVYSNLVDNGITRQDLPSGDEPTTREVVKRKLN